MILRRLFTVGIIFAGLFLPAMLRGTAIAAPGYAVVAYRALATFQTEAAAQAHCPSDTVVWLNTKTGIWHEKGHALVRSDEVRRVRLPQRGRRGRIP